MKVVLGFFFLHVNMYQEIPLVHSKSLVTLETTALPSAGSWPSALTDSMEAPPMDIKSFNTLKNPQFAFDMGAARCVFDEVPWHCVVSWKLLISGYAKIGDAENARQVFNEVPQRDTVCWNAMVSGWAMHGDGKRALWLFSEMEKAGIKPDDIMFIAVFTACSYSGMAYEGLRVLSTMCNVYLIEPKKVNTMGVLLTFLAETSSFKKQGTLYLAEVAADKLLQLERHSGAYVLLPNLYSSAGKHDSARKLRKMKPRGIDKTPGCSSVEINGNVHEFIAGEETHLRMEDVHRLLASVNKHLDSFV
ncbi:hypothetical protein Acr_06g0004410 [Actinidia rufa]|uniref:Pentatricopeptide repeat (PPR) superfamily protein n=1 Tax=Actinidia rufa TaxID=165716 RepID=A0A7J0EPU4_9ERIC|nr:hypothetical protein Acr_06g0004410 [Actinidia rufa]